MSLFVTAMRVPVVLPCWFCGQSLMTRPYRCSSMIIWYMKRHRGVKQTYDKDHDTFRYLFLIVPCAVLALIVNGRFSLFEILWTFSIYLEAVAILPQLVLLQRTKNVDNLTGNYVFLLGLYRAFYILNWAALRS